MTNTHQRVDASDRSGIGAGSLSLREKHECQLLVSDCQVSAKLSHHSLSQASNEMLFIVFYFIKVDAEQQIWNARSTTCSLPFVVNE